MPYTHNITNQHIKNNPIITNQESVDWKISDFALIIADYINFIADTNYCDKTIGFIKINISLLSLQSIINLGKIAFINYTRQLIHSQQICLYFRLLHQYSPPLVCLLPYLAVLHLHQSFQHHLI